MDNRLRIARRELAVLRAEKTIVLALGVQLFIAAFSSFLVVGLVAMYDPSAAEGATVETAVTGETVADLERAAAEVPGVTATAYDSEAAAMDAFEAGAVDAVLVGERAGGRVEVTAVAPDSSVETTVIVVQLRDALRAYERAERERRAADLVAEPLPLPERAGSSPYYTFTYTVLVPLLLFLPVFISGSIAVDSLTEERDRGTLELLRAAPVSPAGILDGKALAAAGLAPAQAAVWLGLLRLNGVPIAAPGALLALVGALSALVVGVALAIAIAAPDRRAAQLLFSTALLALFGVAALSPIDPANAVARLAIGSADPGLYAGVAAAAALAVVAYGTARRRVRARGLG